MALMTKPPSETPPKIVDELTAAGRYIILAAAFLGWMFSGFQMAVMTLSARSATTEFLRSGRITASQPFRLDRVIATPRLRAAILPASTGEQEALDQIAAKWFSWYNAVFLLGAAAGGLVFGWLGDRIGRVRAMGASIFTFSFFSGLAYFAATPEQLLLLRFLCGTGVGGMWPTGVALASEAWSDGSRPLISGMLGTSANVGLTYFNWLGYRYPVVPESWRWTLLVCASPIVLAFFVWAFVPESRRWMAARQNPAVGHARVTMWTVFRPPLLSRTLVGIAVGMIPLLGGWGATQWLIPWSDQVGGLTNPRVKAITGIMRSGGAVFGGLIGGWVASLLGRRLTYFLISLSSLTLGEYIYLALSPRDAAFWPFVFALGFVSTLFFGWLPLYLPELFPTRARSTGAGVSFNFGRILTAAGVLAAGWITFALGDDYGRAGTITTLIFGLGMIVILFAPDTTKEQLQD
jgi:SHS family sialic acid transporter-like MFS transporter